MDDPKKGSLTEAKLDGRTEAAAVGRSGSAEDISGADLTEGAWKQKWRRRCKSAKELRWIPIVGQKSRRS